MSKRQILEYLLESNTSVSLTQVCLSLAMAVVLGMLLYFVYRKTYRGTVYSKDFNLTLLLVAIITTLVMQAIGSNLALSLGMVGSLSIIRFRTAVKEPRDIAFLFWAIAIGLTCGSEMYLIGLLGSIVLTVVVCLANLDLYDTTTYLLILRAGTDAVEEKTLAEVLKKNTRVYKLRMRNQMADSEEFTYEVSFTRKQSAAALSGQVRDAVGADKIRSLNLVSYSGETL